jgi:hypothetical protein
MIAGNLVEGVLAGRGGAIIPRTGREVCVIQIVSLVGSMLILAAFAANQLGRLGSASRPYLSLNLVGSFVLSIIAIEERQWGFLLLEGVWTIVSAFSLWRLQTGRLPTPG